MKEDGEREKEREAEIERGGGRRRERKKERGREKKKEKNGGRDTSSDKTLLSSLHSLHPAAPRLHSPPWQPRAGTPTVTPPSVASESRYPHGYTPLRGNREQVPPRLHPKYPQISQHSIPGFPTTQNIWNVLQWKTITTI